MIDRLGEHHVKAICLKATSVDRHRCRGHAVSDEHPSRLAEISPRVNPTEYDNRCGQPVKESMGRAGRVDTDYRLFDL